MNDLAFCKHARDLGGELTRSDAVARQCARRGVADDAAALRVADDGQNGGRGMGTALGAAGHVHRNALAQACELRRERSGDPARVESEVGAVVVPVEVTDAVMRGVVSLPHGWGHDVEGVDLAVAAAHAGVNSNVLSSRDALDPLSGNAILNGIPVEVTACA